MHTAWASTQSRLRGEACACLSRVSLHAHCGRREAREAREKPPAGSPQQLRRCPFVPGMPLPIRLGTVPPASIPVHRARAIHLSAHTNLRATRILRERARPGSPSTRIRSQRARGRHGALSNRRRRVAEATSQPPSSHVPPSCQAVPTPPETA